MADFIKEGGVGQRLQEQLQARAEEEDNWLNEWWTLFAYLINRKPLPIYTSWYGLDVPRFGRLALLGQLDRAAIAIFAILHSCHVIEDEALPPDRLSADLPLCMEQFKHVFATARLPGLGVDELRTWSGADRPDHVLVLRKGHAFKLNVYADRKRRKPLSLASLAQQCGRIIKQADALGAAESPVGLMTAADRDSWAAERDRLLQDDSNAASLLAVESSLFVICLEDYAPACMLDAAHAAFHGDGRNRWFDKSLQIMVYDDGTVGLCCEHTSSDAPIASRLFEETHAWAHRMALARMDVVDGTFDDADSSLAPPQLLPWHLRSETVAAIRRAGVSFDELVSDVDLHIACFYAFGRAHIKKLRLSPDAFIQAAMQLAYFRLHGRFVLTYESAMTRLFQLGRTDTIRSASDSCCAWVRAMQRRVDLSHPEEAARLLRVALKAHSAKVKQATIGQACDRHLIGLRVLMQLSGEEKHPLFDTDAWNLPFSLATSQTPFGFWCGASTEGGGFGPVVDRCEEGYGVSYMVAPSGDELYFHISSWHSCPTTSSRRFGEAIRLAMLDMSELMLRAEGPKL
eukprot:PLAT7745.1.p1 GENE.PLAT7745.1~~PLAT7745.1.p1  ORF type:complete len:657 (-),score=282.45 PLAT7745.1:88-1803(-)